MSNALINGLRDRFLQYDVVAERRGFTGTETLDSPATTTSGGKPFWLQWRLGLARTRGLRQKFNPETPLQSAAAAALPPLRRTCAGVLPAVCLHPWEDSDEYPLDPPRSSSPECLAGDIPLPRFPRVLLGRDPPLLPSIEDVPAFLSRGPVKKYVENQEGEGTEQEESIGAIGSHTGPGPGPGPVLSDFDPKMPNNIEVNPTRLLLLSSSAPTWEALWKRWRRPLVRHAAAEVSDFRLETYGETDRGKASGRRWSLWAWAWAWACATAKAERRSRRQEAQTPAPLMSWAW
ncbi:Mov34/MPN/PAD-1 family protein [Striga asiatica]|uniref:Mov34/MPN/PAD-1 family protein n=1 Tax=Striga asiatica TaxID=4170 RepID=A0A5A7RJP7_STRAF|nr:Mov34/MPN/PAD-1 family protein [Striga asiatica]